MIDHKVSKNWTIFFGFVYLRIVVFAALTRTVLTTRRGNLIIYACFLPVPAVAHFVLIKQPFIQIQQHCLFAIMTGPWVGVTSGIDRYACVCMLAVYGF